MALEQNYSIRRAGSYELEVKLFEDDGTTPLDPTGMDLHYRIARRVNTDPVLSLDTTDLTIAQDGADWVATIPLTTARTDLLEEPEYYHELYIDDGGELTPMMYGTVTVTATQAERDV